MLLRGLLFVVLSLLYWWVIYFMQEVEAEKGSISKRSASKTKPFRYLQDYLTGFWGDWTSVVVLNFVVGFVYRPSHAPLMLVAGFMGFLLTVLLYVRFMSAKHVPDAGYPKAGVISMSGVLHLGYLFWQMTFGLYLFLLACVGRLDESLFWAAVAAGALYGALLAFDVKAGRFDLKK